MKFDHDTVPLFNLLEGSSVEDGRRGRKEGKEGKGLTVKKK